MIRKEERRGERVLVIDIGYRKKDGTKGRYRHDTKVQTMAAATAEERRLLANIAQYGNVHGTQPEIPENAAPTVTTTFGDIVEKYRATYMVTDLKVTTRRGYGFGRGNSGATASAAP